MGALGRAIRILCDVLGAHASEAGVSWPSCRTPMRFPYCCTPMSPRRGSRSRRRPTAHGSGREARLAAWTERLDGAARVVTVASLAHARGRIDFGNLDASKGYANFRAYAQSKLANLLFAYELHRRLPGGESRAAQRGRAPGMGRHRDGDQAARGTPAAAE
jgi:hypothetical protein